MWNAIVGRARTFQWDLTVDTRISEAEIRRASAGRDAFVNFSVDAREVRGVHHDGAFGPIDFHHPNRHVSMPSRPRESDVENDDFALVPVDEQVADGPQ